MSDLLQVLVPTEDETWLLRACLHENEAARSGWRIWQERVADPKAMLAEDRQGGKQLLPLLYRALRGESGAVDEDFLPYLRTAYFREELRSRTFRELCSAGLAALTAENIPFVVLRGVALAETVYGDWALRHCSDVDLLIRQEDQAEAMRALREVGFDPAPHADGERGRGVTATHASGLPIRLHRDLFSIPYYHPPLDAMWDRSVLKEIASVAVHVLSPEDMLLHVCGHAACSGSRDSLRWVCDAWFVMEKGPDLDWDMLLDSAVRGRLALPLWVMFGYLAHDLGAPVPARVLEAVAAEAADTDRAGLEAALHGARMGRRSSLGSLSAHARSWHSRLALYRWLLLPSPRYLRWRYPTTALSALPRLYVRRPLAYVGRRLRRALRRQDTLDAGAGD